MILLKASEALALKKAKEMPVGTVSKGRKKVADGKWVDVKDDDRTANNAEAVYEATKSPKSKKEDKEDSKAKKETEKQQKVYDTGIGKLKSKGLTSKAKVEQAADDYGKKKGVASGKASLAKFLSDTAGKDFAGVYMQNHGYISSGNMLVDDYNSEKEIS